MNPNDRKYTREHEWIKIDDPATGHAVTGITEYAQDELGDIVYVELPKAGEKFAQMETFAVIESVKAVSDLYCPLSGEILAANDELVARPELANESPYADGWMIRIRPASLEEVENLMTAAEYEALVSGLRT